MLNLLRPHVGHRGRKEKVDERLILRREEIFPRYQQKVVFQILEEHGSFFAARCFSCNTRMNGSDSTIALEICLGSSSK